MPVIKADRTATLLKDAIVLDMGDLRKQGRKIIAAAEAEAQKLIANAQREAALLAKQATDDAVERGKVEGMKFGVKEGREAGHAEALHEASERFTQIQSMWTEAVRQFDARRVEMDRDAREAILELALRFAEKLVHRVVEIDRTVIVDQVAAALGHILRPLDVTARICPEDRPTLEEVMPELMTEFTQCKHVRLVDDSTLSRGGCVVTYGQGVIDASLENQLQRVIEFMLPNNGNSPHPSRELEEEGLEGDQA